MLGTWKRVGLLLVPIDDDATESLVALKQEQKLVVNVSPSRNPDHHRLFFALIKLVVDNTVLFQTVDDALLAIKIACHEVDVWISPSTGEVYYIPRSIKFEKMDQARFRRLFDRAVYVICDQWLAGVDKDELLREVWKLVDGPAAIGERVSPDALSNAKAA